MKESNETPVEVWKTCLCQCQPCCFVSNLGHFKTHSSSTLTDTHRGSEGSMLTKSANMLNTSANILTTSPNIEQTKVIDTETMDIHSYLIALSFIEFPLRIQQKTNIYKIYYIDGNPLNRKVSNLKWGTSSDIVEWKKRKELELLFEELKSYDLTTPLVCESNRLVFLDRLANYQKLLIEVDIDVEIDKYRHVFSSIHWSDRYLKNLRPNTLDRSRVIIQNSREKSLCNSNPIDEIFLYLRHEVMNKVIAYQSRKSNFSKKYNWDRDSLPGFFWGSSLIFRRHVEGGLDLICASQLGRREAKPHPSDQGAELKRSSNQKLHIVGFFTNYNRPSMTMRKKKHHLKKKLVQFGREVYIDRFEIFLPFRRCGFGMLAVNEFIKRSDSRTLHQNPQNQKIQKIKLTPLHSALPFWQTCGFKWDAQESPDEMNYKV